MEPTVIAMFVMIAIGLIVVLAGVYKLLKPDVKFWQVVTPFVFGLLLLGLSAFGLPFMSSYGEFLSKVIPLINAPNSETYSKAMEAIGSGDLAGDNAETAKAIMLENPISEMESLLEQRVGTARDTRGKEQLKEMLIDLRAKKQIARKIADSVTETNVVSADTLRNLDGSTQRLVAQELLQRPQSTMRLTPAQRDLIRRFARPKTPSEKP